MRWFRGHAEAPRLLSLSPLQADEDLEGASYHFHVTSQYRDMSPVRWARRKSSSSESERNCYNVQTSRVTTERTPNKKEKKKIQEERRRICEKRHPLLDRVKNTRLTFFKDRDTDDDDDENDDNEEIDEDDVVVSDRMQFRSMYELSQRGLTRNEFRRSVCENDLKDISEEERIRAKRKRRSKSQNRLVTQRKSQHQEDRYSFLQTSTPESLKHSVLPRETYNETPGPRLSRWRKNKEKDLTEEDRNQIDPNQTGKEGFDSITPSSCLAAKFRAMQDRYLKSSTSKLIAKIYKKDNKECKDGKDKRRLRSFSYGTLPGLEELRTNPLYDDQDQDDNDSGILDNDSATSSLLDDRCSSGASGLMTSQSSTNDSPPRLPPRKPSTSIMDADRTARFFSALDIHCVRSDTKTCSKDILNYDDSSELMEESKSENRKSSELPVIRSKTYTTETMVVKLFRDTPDQCLGIFIAKTTETSPGYLVAHVVPNGLADREGTLKIGDEILIVNGRRLRGLSMAEARKILGNGSGPGEVDIIVSRYSGVDHPKRLKESSVDYENVSIENGHGVIVEDSPKSHFKKHQSKHHRDRKNESARSIVISDKSNLSADNNGSGNQLQTQSVSNFCTLPRRPRSTVSTFLTVLFEKGPGKKSLGFTIVGGKDSPKGSIGIFIKSVLPSGQAAEDGRLRAGDEILAVNGQVCHDLTHREAVQLFRHIKSGPVALHLCRRIKNRETQATKAKSCADLLLVDT
ncbi:PREDICTED: multiple PDZ domain protein-like [Polistes dominula]|uniref:Multiple PDZ domain protein-like n=1 Tax=Polistes dominula TaxID=743375 RepID=A0ABM1I1H1_POLDO|nr:PREDICTED: multiple PDZ domain protein-like [Polistes dominula]